MCKIWICGELFLLQKWKWGMQRQWLIGGRVICEHHEHHSKSRKPEAGHIRDCNILRHTFLNQTLTKKNKNNKWRRDHVENLPLRHSWDNSLGHCCTQQNYCTVYTSSSLGKGVNSSQTLGGLGDLPTPQRCCNGFGLHNGPQTRPQTGPDFYDI